MRADKQHILRYISLFLLLLFTSCARKVENRFQQNGTYPLDKRFEAFYEQLGGLARLGPAISPVIEKGDKRYQYTTAVLLEYDTKSKKVQLTPLGYEFGFSSLPKPTESTNSQQIGNDLKIYPLFQRTYEEMGGAEIIGPPLSEVRYNENQRRYEQYFERAGFFIIEGDVTQTVYLLSYGAWKCRESCSFPIPENSRIDLPSTKAAPMMAFIYRYGIKFSGFALSEPYLAPDGLIEQIFENVVLTFNPEHPEQVDLRPLPQLVGIPPDILQTKQDLADFVWVSVENEKGFLVPMRFWEYLQAHGGLEISGYPQTQVHNLTEGRQRQCFVKLCVEDQIDLFGDQVVRLSKLGETYRRMKAKELGEPREGFELEQITLRSWESQPIVPPDRQQEIGVSVYAGDQPLSGVAPELIITYPNGKEERVNMPPTDQDGKTQLGISPINAENGTLIPYRVCVQDIREEKFCIRDSFIIWKAEELARPHVQYLPAIFNWLAKVYQVFLPYVSR